MSEKHVYLVILALVIALIRFMIPSHPLSPAGSYEAAAHLFVGGLIGAWMVSKKHVFLVMFIVMSLVELTAFFSR